MMNRTNTVLAVLFAAVLVITFASRVDYSKPNLEVLPDMKYTPAWEAYAANPIFSNGQTMQPPVPGTIARGQLPLHYAPTKEDAVRASEELQNPYSLAAIEAAVRAEREAAGSPAEPPAPAATALDASAAATPAPADEATVRTAMVRERYAASIERGGEVYRVFCVACHGPQGAGDGLVTQRGFPPPPSMLTGKSPQMRDGQLFHILTYGQGSMAPFAAQLARDRRWDVINYVRDLQSRVPSMPETVPLGSEAASDSEPPAEPAPQPPGPAAKASSLEDKANEPVIVERENTEKTDSPRNDLREG